MINFELVIIRWKHEKDVVKCKGSTDTPIFD